MIIKRLDIKSFGKLKDVSIKLNPGLNVIYGSNEAGKSTMQSFIKAIFYGMNSQKKNIRDNDRKRFMPWDGSRAEGRLVFEDDNGKEYVIERSFAVQKREDQASVFHWLTGEKAVYMDNNMPGRDIFGLGEEAFEKTLFIKQLGAQIGRDKEDEIMKRLINIHQSGEEDTSYHNAQALLETLRRTIKGVRKNGRLDELQGKIHELGMEKSELERLQNENIEDSISLRNISGSISKIQENLKRMKEDKSNLINWSGDVGLDGDSFGDEDLEDLKAHLRELEDNLQESGSREMQISLKSLQNQLVSLQEKAEAMKNLVLRYEDIRKGIIDINSSLTEYEGFGNFEEGIEYKVKGIQNEIKDKKEKLKVIQDFREMQLQLNSSGVKDNVQLKLDILKDKRNNSLFMLGAGALLCAAGVWGMLSKTASFTMLGALGLLVFVYAAVQLKNLNLKYEETHKLAVEEDKVGQVDREYEERELKGELDKLNKYMEFLYNHCRCNTADGVLEKLTAYKALKGRKNQFEIDLAGLQSEIGREEEKLKQLKTQLEKDILAFETDNESTALNVKLLELEKEKKDIEHSILNRFRGRREMFLVEGELEQCLAEKGQLEELYDCSSLAEEVLKEAFEEIQQNFAPRLNGEVGSILNRITGGKYDELTISSDYEVNVLENGRSRDLEYFSSGTFDQVYLALRLGLCNIIFENRRVPVILDDTFVQYDEERLEKVMDFLNEYSKEHQVIIFTCRRLPGDMSISINT